MSPDFSSALGGSHPLPCSGPCWPFTIHQTGSHFSLPGASYNSQGQPAAKALQTLQEEKGGSEAPQHSGSFHSNLPRAWSRAGEERRLRSRPRPPVCSPPSKGREASLPVSPLRAGQCGYRVAPGLETNPSPPPFTQSTPSVVANFVCCMSVGFPGSEANGTLGMVVHAGG